MNIHAFEHTPKSRYAYLSEQGDAVISFRTARGDDAGVIIHHFDKYDRGAGGQVPMERLFSDELYDYHRVILGGDSRRISYFFEITSGGKSLLYTEGGVRSVDTKDPEAFHYPFRHDEEIYGVPDWVKDAVIYEIFPERFCNGNPELNPPGCQPWGTLPERDNYMGGDLPGITSQLDYLKNLGINCLYLTPIFQSDSNHKYNTFDYYQIDPAFGTKEDFRNLVNQAHVRGIRIVLDAVFNHAGLLFEPFQKALRGEDLYRRWFHFLREEVDAGAIEKLVDRLRSGELRIGTDNFAEETLYHCFAFEPYMPKFNTAHPAAREYLLDVGAYWIREFDIDGWRIDVADEVDHRFWRDFRRVIKDIKPDAYIVGEVWHNPAPWLQGDQFDAAMNYPVQALCFEFFNDRKGSAEDFASRMMKTLFRHPFQVNQVMMNLLGSHDTARLLTVCRDDYRVSTLLFGFLCTIPGAPMIYYGDETGLTGETDPGCRRCFDWDETSWHREIYDSHKRFLALRHGEPALRRGTLRFLSAPEPWLVFSRDYGEDSLLVVINRLPEAPESDYPLPGGYREIFSHAPSGEPWLAFSLRVFRKE